MLFLKENNYNDAINCQAIIIIYIEQNKYFT
jgi:hypothetical protein